MASLIDQAKKSAAERAVSEHFSPTFTHVGIGSGSTVVFVVQAIAAAHPPSTIRFVPTGAQSRSVITSAGLTPLPFDELPNGQLLDVAFDGADEVDAALNCIKGGGACLYQEKLVATRARKFVCVADHRKRRPRLLTEWPSVPVEVEPLARHAVIAALKGMGSTDPRVRMVKGGEGASTVEQPLRTDQGNLIVDAPFVQPLALPKDVLHPTQAHGEGGRWEVVTLAKEIKAIEGVLSVGIFAGENGDEALASGKSTGGARPVMAYFGMADGSVFVQKPGDEVAYD